MERAQERAHRGRHRRFEILLVCAERIGSRIECVAEELRARGHDVELQLGKAGKEALKSTLRLRVLCVAEQLSVGQLDRLELSLDPDGQGNLLVAALDRTAVGMANRVESFGQQVAQRRRTARATRSIALLPVPRKSVNPKRWIVPASAAAAALVGLFAVLQFGGGAEHDDAKVTETPPTATKTIAAPSVAPEPTLNDTPIRVSVSTDEPSDSEIQIFDIEEPKGSARKPRPAASEKKSDRPAPAPPAEFGGLGEGSSAAVSAVSSGQSRVINLGTAALLGNATPKPPAEEPPEQPVPTP